MSVRPAVAYLRVSTDRQGRSGLGLEGQEEAITAFVRTEGFRVVGRFVEVESGRKAERPQLQAALERCRVTGATLLVAKLDRLARNAHFLLGLRDAGVDFVAVDMPHANRLTVGIMALVAEEEARMISARTKAALRAAKARGVALGGMRGTKEEVQERAKAVRPVAHAAVKAAADAWAQRLAPLVAEARAQGITSQSGIARFFDKEGIATARGGKWTNVQVAALLERLK